LVFMDSLAPQIARKGMTMAQKLWAARKWDIEFAFGWFQRRGGRQNERNTAAEIDRLLANGEALPDELIGQRMTDAYSRAQWLYEPSPYSGPVTLFKARKAQTLFLHAGTLLGWQGILTGKVIAHTLDCDHFTMMAGQSVAEIGTQMNAALLP
jgi:thioesterase domain-containing protein